MGLYLIANGPQQTTASFAKVSTGTGIITMMQVKPGPTCIMRIIEWGWSLDGFAAALPGQIELIETGTVPATSLTAYAAADITKYDSDALMAGDPTTSLFTVTSTNTSGYTAGAEGSITAVRNLAGPQLGAPTNEFIQQFPLGREPVVQPSNFMRIRAKFGTSVGMYCYVIVQV